MAFGTLWRQDVLSNCLPASSKDWTSIVTQVWDSVGWWCALIECDDHSYTDTEF